MLAFDTNLVIYAANADAPQCTPARAFLDALRDRDDVVVCELMLVEVYLKLRNARILARPFDAPDAAAFCDAFRRHPRWQLVEAAPVMREVWPRAAAPSFALRRIIDLRLGLTLRHFGVTEFATTNTKDFEGLGFTRVWDPLAAARPERPLQG